ncbi:N-6 DNA methylase, partial [Streptococcus suis]
CILVLAKNKNTTDTLFIDASREFKKETNNNILTEDNIQNILDGFDKGEDKEYFVSVASYEKIVENDYNLSVSTYVEKEDTREKIDIVQLNKDIAET